MHIFDEAVITSVGTRSKITKVKFGNFFMCTGHFVPQKLKGFVNDDKFDF